jgi:hypothetical protein
VVADGMADLEKVNILRYEVREIEDGRGAVERLTNEREKAVVTSVS